VAAAIPILLLAWYLKNKWLANKEMVSQRRKEERIT